MFFRRILHCFFLFTIHVSIAETPYLKFYHLSLEDGLSQSIVECIIQDSRGFMWFCTEDGLNQYDGYTFDVLKSDPNNPQSLSQNHITCMIEADNGILWIGAFNGGLNRYNPSTRTIKTFRANPEKMDALCHDVIRDIFQDDAGILWIATEGGLARLDPLTEEFTCYRHNPHDPRTISDESVHSICQDNQGRLWIATENGLNSFDRETNRFSRFYHDPNNDNSLIDNYVRELCADRNGALWIGTHNSGLDKLTFNAMGMPQFTHFVHKANDPTSLSHNSIYALLQDSQGTLWIGTKGGGLNVFDPETLSFHSYQNNPFDAFSINYDEIYDIYEDNTGVIWLGTYGGGANKVSRAVDQFPHYKSNPANPNSLNHDIVWSILEDENGVLWIGTHGGGLNRFDRVNDKWRSFQHDEHNPHSISHDIVRVVFKDQQNRMWLATDGGGLNKFDPATDRFTSYRHNPNDPNTIAGNELRSIFQDSRGFLWVGTYGSGLDKFDPESEHFTHYRHHPDDANTICDDYIRTVYEDQNGILWIGTQGGGLSRFDPRTETFTHFKNDPQDSTSLSNDFVFVILENPDGSMWLGTYGGGLNRFDPNSGICKRYTEVDGLADNSVYGIIRDDDGQLWISTTNGISRFNPFNETFTNYNIDDGLQSTEFNGGACFKSKSGEIFFGGINGFNAFYPENIHHNENKPRIVLTQFSKFNQPVNLPVPLSELSELKLSWKDYSFSFEFAALDFTAPKRNLYAYKMEGIDKEWIYTDADNRIARYTTLAPGKYTFRVKGSNNDNVWNDEGIALRLIITPPFWQTAGFRFMVALFIVGLLYVIYAWRTRAQEQKRRELEERVTERTVAAKKLQEALDEVQVLKNRLEAENVYLQDEIKVVTNFENIITQSDALKKVLSKVEQVADTNATALVLGESGTGKELIARAIHTLSDRSDHILVKVNCSALPANLIESEFFGHEKGAFTGAICKKVGRFELADGGTIFLDEIGDLPLELQAKLLRVLQEGEFERVGGNETIKVDVRIIAATNRNLPREIEKGNFRDDLYFRLNVFPLVIPPLRQRKEDIPLLVNYFVKKYSAKTGKKIDNVPQNVLNALERYPWPGNVRELENIIERAVITSRNATLTLGDWLPHNETPSNAPEVFTLDENERRHILQVLNKTNWRVSGDKGAAKILGINPKTLESRMKKLNIVKQT